MKKWIYALLILAVLLSLSACANSPAQQETLAQEPPPVLTAQPIDVDLTLLNSIMVYSEVYNMMVTPEDYIGKIVKMKGNFVVYEDEAAGKNYYAVIIADATACCSQGLEFIWKGEHSYPDDYPEQDTTITVVGRFQTYEENGNLYCHLVDADLT